MVHGSKQSTIRSRRLNKFNNGNLNHLVKPSFQGINRLFVLAFGNDDHRISNKRCYIPNVEIKDYNVMIDGKNFYDQPVRNDKVTYGNNCYRPGR